MIKKTNNSNNLIISHIADIDGLSCVILSKLVYKDIDVILCDVSELSEVFSSLNDSNYNTIYISDLPIRDTSLLDNINNNFNNVYHFDHHLNEIDLTNYPWSITINEVNGFKPSGTSLFYDYLLENFPDNKYINSSYTKSFVEAVRSYDTWDFKNTGNLDGKYLTEIFSIIGIDDFIDKYYEKIIANYKNEGLEFDDKEMNMIKRLETEIAEYVDNCDKSLIVTKFLGFKVGISISEHYRSEVGNALSTRHKDLDFILLANFVRGAFSLRTTNDINLNEVAKLIGGGGHPKAAHADMNNENLKLFFESLKK